jgi:uncharacterized membrane protein YqaE (UPF0057 family)
VTDPLAIVAAILLPPLGVFLDRGITPAFWICVALTCLGFIPGMIFALFTLLSPRPTPEAGGQARSPS